MRTRPETPLAAASPLSADERRKREDAVRFANASISLEGFNVSAEAHARAVRFIAGEIDLAEFLEGDSEQLQRAECCRLPRAGERLKVIHG